MIHFPHHHNKIGVVKLVLNKRSKRYILKVKYGEVIVTVPDPFSIEVVNKLLDNHTQQVLDELGNQVDYRVKEGFHFESEVANVSIVRSTLAKPSLKVDGKHLTILLSRSQDEMTEHSQMILIKIIEKHLREMGTDVVFARLKYWSEQMKLSFARFKLGNAKTAWGKCDSLRNIVISVYAALLPDHLLDYLLIHELAHISEMNHSDRFWSLVDKFTGNRAKELREELKGYNTSIVQFKKA